jgi:uncharacterized protein YjbI with pentapeptide repeats
MKNISTHEFAVLVRQLPTASAERRIEGFKLDKLKSKLKLKRVEGVAFAAIDFAGVIMEGGLLGRLVFEDCTFQQVEFGPAFMKKVEFRNCSFIGCGFGNDYRCFIVDTRFVQCRFDDSEMRDIDIVECEFSDSQFASGDSGSLSVRESTFTGVDFSGRWGQATFLNSRLDSCRFVNATFSNVSFRHCDLRNLELPARPESFGVRDGEQARQILALIPTLSVSVLEASERVLSDGRDFPVIVGEDTFYTLGKQDSEIVRGALFSSLYGGSEY